MFNVCVMILNSNPIFVMISMAFAGFRGAFHFGFFLSELFMMYNLFRRYPDSICFFRCGVGNVENRCPQNICFMIPDSIESFAVVYVALRICVHKFFHLGIFLTALFVSVQFIRHCAGFDWGFCYGACGVKNLCSRSFYLVLFFINVINVGGM